MTRYLAKYSTYRANTSYIRFRRQRRRIYERQKFNFQRQRVPFLHVMARQDSVPYKKLISRNSLRWSSLIWKTTRTSYFRYEIREMIQKIKILQSEQRNNAECQDASLIGIQKFQQIHRYDHNGSVVGVAQPLLERRSIDPGKALCITIQTIMTKHFSNGNFFFSYSWN